ncbi:MAG TPA: thioredoxin family protein [Coxiellaceae bacterium]|nr:MAG: thiol reductase thioredoxin [Gammaproteobacteria bacterium RIFCSPHIGHO2_12_FULL_36_30]HLB56337.1 thioredoxin family protein [Coxiellaceae bacterium]
MSVQELTAANFDVMVESNELLVIDFWAEWCGPCKAFSKIMTDVAKEYQDVVFASVNIENEKALAEEFAVRSIPFVMIIKKRAVVYADSGLLSAVSLRELLDQAKALKA